MSTVIKLRRDTEANWTTVNPVLAEGEMCLVIDGNGNTINTKVGDGVSTFTELPYFTGQMTDLTTGIKYTLGVDNGNIILIEV